jgi:FAD/FMN-containing dehydrogenase
VTETVSVVPLNILRAAVAGDVLLPGEAGYDGARSLWNGDIDRHPAVIVQCADAADVALGVRFARDQGLEITVRGGGHNAAGRAAADGALMIELSHMRLVSVDPQRRTALVQGGATLADLDAATQAHGLATTGGTVSHTGVAGLTLGGGMGWLTRKHGLAIDNLLSAAVVTATGDVLSASADSHPDLFWALRGGGGNFGVVTEFEFALHPVDPVVHLGVLFWPNERAPAALRVFADVLAALPRGVSTMLAGMDAPDAPFVPLEHQGTTGWMLLVTSFDGPEVLEQVLNQLRAVPPLIDAAMPVPYVVLQQLIDEGVPWGICAHERGLYVEQIDEAVIDVLTAQLPRRSSPASKVIGFPLGGAYSEVDDEATAFAGARSDRINFWIIGLAPTPQLLGPDRDWARATWQALQPHAMQDRYVNVVFDQDEDRIRAAYGTDRYERLARVKATYDPHNVFHHNANILPAPPLDIPTGRSSPDAS